MNPPTIDQQLHVFWLEISDVESRWTLYVDAPTSRRGRNAIDVAERPADMTWSVILHGHVELRGGEVVPVVDEV